MTVASSNGYIFGEEKYAIIEAYNKGKEYIRLNGAKVRILGLLNTYLGFILKVEVEK